MPDDLGDALAALRPLLLDENALVRAVAAGRRRNERPRGSASSCGPST